MERFGADSLRTYICFMGPPIKGGDWSDEGVEGVFRFSPGSGGSARGRGGTEQADQPDGANGPARELLAKAHWAIDKATRDIDPRFQFNTAIAAVMELVNKIYELKDGLYEDPTGAPRSASRPRPRPRCSSPSRPIWARRSTSG